MVRLREPNAVFMVMLLVSIGVLALMPLACASSEELALPPLGQTLSLNELQELAKKYPKLDSQLIQLVIADRGGGAASFAKQHGLSLVDGRVRVIIEAMPGQAEAATKAATGAGAKVETTADELVQALVPINKLISISQAESIRLVRRPMTPVPGPRMEPATPQPYTEFWNGLEAGDPIRQFVRNMKVREPRSRYARVIMNLPDKELRVFRASYSYPEIAGDFGVSFTAIGIEHRGKIGFISISNIGRTDVSQLVMYDFDNSDTYLFTDDFWKLLESREEWHFRYGFLPNLAADGDVPRDVLWRIMTGGRTLELGVIWSLLRNPAAQKDNEIVTFLATLPASRGDPYKEVRAAAQELLEKIASSDGQAKMLEPRPVPVPEIRPPNFDPQLYELARAYNENVVESYAKEHGIELIGERVRVMLESVSNPDFIKWELTRAGAEVERVSSDDLVWAVVPLAQLVNLTYSPVIGVIRLPTSPAGWLFPELTEKGPSNLESVLYELARAAKQGEETLYAQRNGIELVDWLRVRLVIETVPGQDDAANQAFAAAGARGEMSYTNWYKMAQPNTWCKAIVPIYRLIDLAKSEGIQLIRLPRPPAPARPF